MGAVHGVEVDRVPLAVLQLFTRVPGKEMQSLAQRRRQAANGALQKGDDIRVSLAYGHVRTQGRHQGGIATEARGGVADAQMWMALQADRATEQLLASGGGAPLQGLPPLGKRILVSQDHGP